MEHDCVLKFGGSSLCSHEEVLECAKLVDRRIRRGERIVVVVSAMGSTTDQLVALARSLDLESGTSARDLLLASGEQIAAAAMTIALKRLGHQAIPLTGGEAGLITDRNHGRAQIVRISPGRITHELDRTCIPVVMGFQGTTSDGVLTTLGRGGSDTTAVALAGALGRTSRPTRCEVCTDVSGVHSSDPRLVTGTRLLDSIDFGRMMLLARSGARVMAPSAIEHAERFGVPIHVFGGTNAGYGTLIGAPEQAASMPGVLACAIKEGLGHVRLRVAESDRFMPDRLASDLAGSGFEFVSLDHQLAADGGHVFDCSCPEDLCTQVADVMSAHSPVRSSSFHIDARTGLASIGIVGSGFLSAQSPIHRALEGLSSHRVGGCPIVLDDRHCRVMVHGESAISLLQQVHDAVGLTVDPGAPAP